MARRHRKDPNPDKPTPHERSGKVEKPPKGTSERIWKRLQDRNPELRDKDDE